MSDRAFLVEHIATLVRGGKSPAQAAKDLMLLLGSDHGAELELALAEYERQTGRIRSLIDSTLVSIEAPDLQNWYPGPSPDDRFWPALRRHLLEERNRPQEVVDSIDHSSTKVIALLQPPGLGKIETRGLVLGFVQSGKTANFSAVIAKAADVNYKFFIVLSGITNGLRRQTQFRLDRELVALNPEHWVTLTSPDSDFRRPGGGNASAFLTDHHAARVLCVVKKNASVLRRLKTWLTSAREEILRNCPVLIIDDEADQATVNAAGDGQDRTVINRLLLEILGRLPKAAYVGYTATPFANIFIDASIPEDLYPRDFILDLPRPPDYFGPERVFGREPLTPDEAETPRDGLDMIRIVPADEIAGLRPARQTDRPTFAPLLTPSLAEALRYFWLAAAARITRGDDREHISMLIHTTLYAAIHERFRPLIEGYRDDLLSRVRRGDEAILGELRRLWDSEQACVPSAVLGETATPFHDLQLNLVSALERSQVVIENSLTDSRLEFPEDEGRIQIVVGGNTLARGLTIEGLTVSYFVRAASAYDTLLQMGRWFGYRHGYSDLPRIWMTAELEENFRLLATVEQEMRNDIRRYELESLTPLQFGVRIRTHPDLAITSRLKMRAAVDCSISYSGRRVQTILFNHRDAGWLRRNLTAARALVRDAAADGVALERGESPHVILRGVHMRHILAFLGTYRFHENSVELQAGLLRQYIQAQNRDGALHDWNVVFIGRRVNANDELLELAPDLRVPLLNRARMRPPGPDTDYANLKAIMSEVDKVADLGEQDLRGKSSADLQAMRPRGLGLLVLYPIARDSRPQTAAAEGEGQKRVPLDAVEHLIGVGLVFPEAQNLTPQGYKVNPLPAAYVEEPEVPEDADEDGVA